MVVLPELTAWNRMCAEYRSMGLHPESHVMSYIRLYLDSQVINSQRVMELEEDSQVIVAGLVIRRQMPLGEVVFITLEDEFGHTPLLIWPNVYKRYRQVLEEPVVLVRGTVCRRDGTINVVVSDASTISAPLLNVLPRVKEWR